MTDNADIKLEPKIVETNRVPTPTKPNEVGGIYLRSGIKVFDPTTGQIYIQKSE